MAAPSILPVLGVILAVVVSNSDPKRPVTRGISNSHTQSTVKPLISTDAVRTVATPKKTARPRGIARNQARSRVAEEQGDYETIYRFITSRYKYTKKEDARLIAKHLVEYGKKHDMDPKLVAALMARESSFNRKAVSRTGAKGLGQIKDFNHQSLKITDPFSIQQNASGTTQYLSRMIGRWRGSSEKVALGLASYYKGYTAVKRDKGGFDKATKGYVTDILKYYDDLKGMKSTR